MSQTPPEPGASTRGKAAALQLWRTSRQTPTPTATWGSALRRGLVVAAIFVVAAVTNQMAIGGVAAIGALNIGLVDAALPRRTLMRTLLTLVICTVLVAGWSSLLAASWWIVPFLAVLALVHGLLAGSGWVLLNATLMSLITGVVFSGQPGDWGHALFVMQWMLIGCLVQAVASLIAWRYDREASLRRQISIAVRAVENYLTGGVGDGKYRMIAAVTEETAERVVKDAGLPAERGAALEELLRQLSWLRFAVTRWLLEDQPTAAQRQVVAEAIAGYHELIDKAPVSQTPASLPALEYSDDVALTLLTAQISKFGDAAMAVNAMGHHPKRTAELMSSSRDRLARPWLVVTALRHPSPEMVRAGLRLAVAVAVAQSLEFAFDLVHGYWVTLTVVMVLKPDFALTVSRGLLRIVGTIAAVVLVGTILALTHEGSWAMVALVVVFAPLTMRWFTGNYAMAAFAITGAVLTMVDASEPSEDIVAVRLVNTLIGAAIALSASFLWPSWRGDRLPELLAAMVTAQKAWTGAVLRGLGGAADFDVSATRELGKICRGAALRAQPAAEAALVEPHRPDSDPQAGIALVRSSERAALATMSLEVLIRDRLEGRASYVEPVRTDAIGRLFDHDCDVALAAVAGADLPPMTAPATREQLGIAHVADPIARHALSALVAAGETAAAAGRRI